MLRNCFWHFVHNFEQIEKIHDLNKSFSEKNDNDQVIVEQELIFGNQLNSPKT